MKHTETPINYKIVKQMIDESGLPSIGHGTIREIVRIVNNIEKATGEKFIRMEMGVPGILPPEIGTNAEIKALKEGLASKYPMMEGVSELKKELSRFLKLFLNVEVNEEGCLPTVGSMQGSMATFMVANRTDHLKKGTLFIDPGFPVHKQQCAILGHDFESFDVYNYRGIKLKEKIESYLKKGTVSSILYSNPNNPAWICFSRDELKIIGDLANKYDVIIIEDLAYIGMDFREDYSKPGQEPYQPTVAHYTNNYILLISSSKAFSYAGQRIGTMAISDYLFNRKYPDLKRYFTTDLFGYSMIYGVLYALSAGVSHTAQYGLAAMLRAANDGEFNFVDQVKLYGQRAAMAKKIFVENGFKIVYDKDEDKPIADGFYFTFAYPGMTGVELLEKLLYYGISAISLDITGSVKEGLRACVSQITENQYKDLEYRLQKFNEQYE
jgi:aspartate/methionine/tyrosine aminotransferase